MTTLKTRKCVGCNKEFKPLHAGHRWHNDGCYRSHFRREHGGDDTALGMRPLGLFGDKKVIRVFHRKHSACT